MSFDVGRALEELGINGFKLEGNPTTESEFNAAFEDGAPVFSSNPDDFGITWAQVIGAKAALNNVFGKQDLRYERNIRLEETDHWALQDTPDMTQAQRDYRQALRDITNTYTSLDDVVWPEKP
jgi:hypothetical protein